jgi:hypothetical protein
VAWISRKRRSNAEDSGATMTTDIPDALKADVPKSGWGKILVSTPVVMTVIATLLAGLASSEMTRAQYDRSLAAQLQSKAGDQWGYFQAKKLRSSLQNTTLDFLRATAALRPLDATVLKRFGEIDPKALEALLKGELPETPRAAMAPNVKAALDALENARPEADISSLLGAVSDEGLADALKAAKANVQEFDAAIGPITRVVDQIDKALAAGNVLDVTRDYTVARLRFAAARYEAEARGNQVIANLLELQVRKAVLSSDRHYRRSERFFYGMLAAQAAVIVSTLSLAAQKRSVLWTLAAIAGLAAIAFATYVYFYV